MKYRALENYCSVGFSRPGVEKGKVYYFTDDYTRDTRDTIVDGTGELEYYNVRLAPFSEPLGVIAKTMHHLYFEEDHSEFTDKLDELLK